MCVLKVHDAVYIMQGQPACAQAARGAARRCCRTSCRVHLSRRMQEAVQIMQRCYASALQSAEGVQLENTRGCAGCPRSWQQRPPI